MSKQIDAVADQKTLNESNRSPLKNILGPKGKLLVGNFLDIEFEQFHVYLKEQSQQYGKIFKLSLAQKPLVVLSEAATVRQILKSRPGDYRRISAMQDVFSELGINGVFSAEGEEWRVQRKMMNHAFKPSQLQQYYPIITSTTNRLISTLLEHAKQNSSLDLQTLMQCFTIDITTQLAFGYDVNSLENSESELQKMLSLVFPMISYRIKAPFPYWRYFKLKKDKDLDAAMAFIKTHCNQFIAVAEKKIEQHGKANNILESMILARNEEGIEFSQQQLFANIITLLLAGEDTTANTLSWTIHYLIENPKYQRELQQEITEKTPSLDLSDPKNLDQLPLLSGIIQEAMRLMPVAPFLYIENIEDQMLEGYNIPAGTMLVLMLAQSGHDENKFPQPASFQPERWLNLTEEDRKQRTKELMYFGSGARLCPGMQLAYIEIKYALIAIFKQFSFSVNGANVTKSQFAFTVSPKNLNVNVQRNP